MADLPLISKITVPVTSGGVTTATTYEIKDAWARTEISNIETSITGAMHYKGITTTAISDGSTTSTLSIDGESVTFGADDAGAVVIYGENEFVWNGSKWQEFGSTGSLKALAFADTASGSYTTVTGVSTNTTTDVTPIISISTTANSSGNYQPEGTMTNPTITVDSAGSTDTVYSITDVGTLPVFEYTSGTETITFTSGTLPTKGSAQTVKTGDASYVATGTAFTGTKVQISGSSTAVAVPATYTVSTGTDTVTVSPDTV